MGGRQQAQAFIWPAPIPTRPLSADDAETHMDPISATSSLLLLWYGMESIYGSAEHSVLIQLLLHHASPIMHAF